MSMNRFVHLFYYVAMSWPEALHICKGHRDNTNDNLLIRFSHSGHEKVTPISYCNIN
jgi:hypothetical protein